MTGHTIMSRLLGLQLLVCLATTWLAATNSPAWMSVFSALVGTGTILFPVLFKIGCTPAVAHAYGRLPEHLRLCLTIPVALCDLATEAAARILAFLRLAMVVSAAELVQPACSLSRLRIRTTDDPPCQRLLLSSKNPLRGPPLVLALPPTR